MSLITPEIRASAEICTGHDICKERLRTILKEHYLPDGLLPVVDAEELGYVKETGFMWVKQKNDIVHKYEKAGKQVSYASELTLNIEKCKITKLTGARSKEMFLWITIEQIHVEDPSSDKITMTTPRGIYRTMEKAAFEWDW